MPGRCRRAGGRRWRGWTDCSGRTTGPGIVVRIVVNLVRRLRKLDSGGVQFRFKLLVRLEGIEPPTLRSGATPSILRPHTVQSHRTRLDRLNPLSHLPTTIHGLTGSRHATVTGSRRGTHRFDPPPPAEARAQRARRSPVWSTRSHVRESP